MRKLLLFGAFLAAACGQVSSIMPVESSGQSGQFFLIVDSSGAPVSAATIRRGVLSTQTNTSGYAHLPAQFGLDSSSVVRLKRNGFSTVDIQPGEINAVVLPKKGEKAKVFAQASVTASIWEQLIDLFQQNIPAIAAKVVSIPADTTDVVAVEEPTPAPNATPEVAVEILTPMPMSIPTGVPPTAAPISTPPPNTMVILTVIPSATPEAPPTVTPLVSPTVVPLVSPTAVPLVSPTAAPLASPTIAPLVSSTAAPLAPTASPTVAPTASPTPSRPDGSTRAFVLYVCVTGETTVSFESDGLHVTSSSPYDIAEHESFTGSGMAYSCNTLKRDGRLNVAVGRVENWIPGDIARARWSEMPINSVLLWNFQWTTLQVFETTIPLPYDTWSEDVTWQAAGARAWKFTYHGLIGRTIRFGVSLQ